MIQTPPVCPIRLSVEATHYHKYHIATEGHTSENPDLDITLATWQDMACPPLRQDMKPHVLWKLLRQHLVMTTTTDFYDLFGIELTLSVPEGTKLNVAEVTKPLLDGIVSSFHVHDGSDLLVLLDRLSKLTDDSKSNLKSLLMESDMAVLGKTRLLHPRGTGVQWNPSDHLCIQGKITVKYKNSPSWTLSVYAHIG